MSEPQHEAASGWDLSAIAKGPAAARAARQPVTLGARFNLKRLPDEAIRDVLQTVGEPKAQSAAFVAGLRELLEGEMRRRRSKGASELMPFLVPLVIGALLVCGGALAGFSRTFFTIAAALNAIDLIWTAAAARRNKLTMAITHLDPLTVCASQQLLTGILIELEFEACGFRPTRHGRLSDLKAECEFLFAVLDGLASEVIKRHRSMRVPETLIRCPSSFQSS